MERAALGLLRVVGRLLAYKEGADGLVDSLQLLTKMRTQLAWDLAPKVTAQVLSAGWLSPWASLAAMFIMNRC